MKSRDGERFVHPACLGGVAISYPILYRGVTNSYPPPLVFTPKKGALNQGGGFVSLDASFMEFCGGFPHFYLRNASEVGSPPLYKGGLGLFGRNLYNFTTLQFRLQKLKS